MDLQLDYSLGDSYKSNTQKMRVITETWVAKNLFCPICGNDDISRYESNRPVADFFCADCHADFELKSKELQTNRLPSIIADGAYKTMISRITSDNNPHFFILVHHDQIIRHFFLVPKYYFIPRYIEKRPPLSATARRAGWIGCNINLASIPQTGLIFIIKNEEQVRKDIVLEQVARMKEMNHHSLEERGWLFEVLKCIEQIQKKEFSLRDIYAYADYLSGIHQKNHNIEAKIRQQLQIIRDKGFIEFLGHGQYRTRSKNDETIYNCSAGNGRWRV